VAARATVKLPEEGKWIEQVAGATGLSVDLLQQLVNLADEGSFDGTSIEVVGAILKWLEGKPIVLLELVRPESLEGLLGDKYKRLPNDEKRAPLALAAVNQLLPLWMAGVPLCEIEAAYLGRKENLGRCEHARQFVSRVVPDLAFLAGLPARLLTARAKSARGEMSPLHTVLTTLGSTVREGCESPEALATRVNCGRTISRVASRQEYDRIKRYVQAGSPTEDFEDTRQRMRSAEIAATFASLQ
jgi:hypothetical protein